MLHGVIINGTNTLSAHGLILLDDLRIEEPTKKENRINIPGADGELDLSNAPQGRPVYNNRQISFTLFKAVGEMDLETLRTSLRNAYHGQTAALILPNDPTHYYRGVMSIGAASGYNTGRIPVSMSAYPYKLKLADTVVAVTVSGTATAVLQNERRPVAPKISTTAEITVSWGSSSVSLSAGEDWTVPGLILGPGDTEITIAGNADVSIRYQEGSL